MGYARYEPRSGTRAYCISDSGAGSMEEGFNVLDGADPGQVGEDVVSTAPTQHQAKLDNRPSRGG